MKSERQELIEAAEVLLATHCCDDGSVDYDGTTIECPVCIPVRDAISAARKASEGGWIEIKQGMPKESGDILVVQLGAQKVVWQNGEGWFDQGRCVGTPEDMGITHYRSLPSPPLSVETQEVQK